MTVGILTEKPSAAKNFAKALGGAQGNFQGTDYVIVAARGHLCEMVQPEEMVGTDLRDKYKDWALDNLPWDPDEMSFARQRKRDVSKTGKPLKTSKDADRVFSTIASALNKCDEVVIATDIDPTGEGDLLGWEVIDDLDLHHKTLTRMEFTDEAPKSIQQAFLKRRPITSMMDEGNYRKALYRSQFDLLSMQWTRVLTYVAKQGGMNALQRAGRLKSGIVVLVGDQIKAHKNYVKKPYFENRFKDEVGIEYVNKNEPRFASKDEVPQDYKPSSVVVDGAEKKFTAPPKLLDLAGLSSLLAPKGHSSKKILSTYQKMYEDQVVSYPRTEDKTITTEQFNELVSNADAIAKVVGVDPSVLTRRKPRGSHVKDSGAHGANRPGPNVPPSLDMVAKKYGQLGADIYDLLARSVLRILAEDYSYKHYTAHVKDYPDFVGHLNVKLSGGWKDIFSDSDEEEDSTAVTQPGTTAEPFIYEGVNKRPPMPTMKWLMKALEKHNVGTGATRTSTYSEVTSGKTALLKDSRGKITLTPTGEVNYNLLPGTHIGNLAMTEKVYAHMDAIAEGKEAGPTVLHEVADMIKDDIDIVKKNESGLSPELRTTMAQATGGSGVERFEGIFAPTGETVKFKRQWPGGEKGHRFSDEECDKLLTGEWVPVWDVEGSKGKKFSAMGKLEQQEFTTKDGEVRPFWGFKADFSKPMPGQGIVHEPTGKEVALPKEWCKHEFTQEEKAKLAKGEIIHIDDAVSAKGNQFECDMTIGESTYNGQTKFGLKPLFDKKK